MEHPNCLLLIRLPRELRDRIYNEALVVADDINIENLEYDEPWSRDEFPEPGLLHTCKQIRHEALSIYYERNIFRAIIFDEDSTPPVRWLQSIGSKGRKAVRNLVLQYQLSPATRDRLEADKEFSLQGSVRHALKAILGHHDSSPRCVQLVRRLAAFSDFDLSRVLLDTGERDYEPVLEHRKHHWRADMHQALSRHIRRVGGETG